MPAAKAWQVSKQTPARSPRGRKFPVADARCHEVHAEQLDHGREGRRARLPEGYGRRLHCGITAMAPTAEKDGAEALEQVQTSGMTLLGTRRSDAKVECRR